MLDSKDEIDRRVCEGKLSEEEKGKLREMDRRIDVDAAAPLLIHSLSESSRQSFEQVQNGLTLLSIPFTVNPYLVRGLDYYCHTSFEFVVLPSYLSCANPQLAIPVGSALLAGGRYDGLFAQLNGEESVAVVIPST